MDDIDRFIEAISKFQAANLFNPWAQTCVTDLVDQAHLVRRKRLRAHMQCPDPKLILIGEAPGYQGCRYSGIAFTSERLLLEDKIPHIPSLKGARITERKLPWSEPSATIVWGELIKYGVADNTILFNAVPWHPEGKNGIHSNRTPTKTEQKLGNELLLQFLSLYPTAKIGALGKTASNNMNELGIENTALRHPANGGATKYRNGLAEMLGLPIPELNHAKQLPLLK